MSMIQLRSGNSGIEFLLMNCLVYLTSFIAFLMATPGSKDWAKLALVKKKLVQWGVKFQLTVKLVRLPLR